MSEEEKMVFWGDLVEPITSLLGGLAVRGEDKLYKVVLAIIDKTEKAALEEREACAKIVEIRSDSDDPYCCSPLREQIAQDIRARGQA